MTSQAFVATGAGRGSVPDAAREMVELGGELVDGGQNDLLDVTRIDQGKIELRREVTDLRSALEAAIDGAQHKIDMGGHALEFDAPEGPVLLDIDAVRMTRWSAI